MLRLHAKTASTWTDATCPLRVACSRRSGYGHTWSDSLSGFWQRWSPVATVPFVPEWASRQEDYKPSHEVVSGVHRAFGSHRTGRPRQGWHIPLITSSGFKTCWLAPRDCCTCGARAFPYFWSNSGEPQHQLPSGSWQYSPDKARQQQLLVVRHRQAVETEYMKAIDIRMRLCPFTWAKLHAGCHGRVATLARDLRSGWQL